ncbi:MAG: carbohydrate porin [Planctomycetota bacterium]|nr:carbohydrate porin [Planctomycetota bacterium]
MFSVHWHSLLGALLLSIPAWSDQVESTSTTGDDAASENSTSTGEPVESGQSDPATEDQASADDEQDTTSPEADPTKSQVHVVGDNEVIITNSTHPIRRGHGGWEVYNRAGQRQKGLRIPSGSTVGQVPGEEMPIQVPDWEGGLLPFLFSDGSQRKSTQENATGKLPSTGGWTGKGLRIITDEHKLAQVSEPLLDFDPFDPLNQTISFLRRDLLDPLSITFQPSMAWTYQHATEVRPGYQHGRSVLWFGLDGAVILWNNEDNSARVVYNIQAQVGAFTPTTPFLGTAVGSPLIVNNILIGSNFNLYMLYWAQQLFEKKVTVIVGKFEDQVYFDANAVAYNPLTQFMYEGFNQSITNPFPGYGFGGLVEWSITDDFRVRMGTMNSETTSKASGFEYLSADHLFTMFQSTLDLELEYAGEVHEGHYRMMVWYNSIGDTGTGKSPWDAAGWGVTFNMDQRVWEGLGVFCRVGWGENDVTSSNFSVSAGFSIEDFLGRQGDCIGFAGSWSKITELGRYDADLPMIPGDQTLFELFWRINLTDSVQVSPVLQYVHDAGAGIDNSWIWGIRSVWSF